MKARICYKHVVLERLDDISAICSHCCLMVQDHETYICGGRSMDRILDVDVSNYVTTFV
jgi:hypothetical protein